MAGPQPHRILRLDYRIARLGRWGPSPTGSCGSPTRLLASDGGAAAPQDPAARPPDCSPRTVGPSPTGSCGSPTGLLASDGGTPAPRDPAARLPVMRRVALGSLASRARVPATG